MHLLEPQRGLLRLFARRILRRLGWSLRLFRNVRAQFRRRSRPAPAAKHCDPDNSAEAFHPRRRRDRAPTPPLSRRYRRVVDPLVLKDVLRPVADKHQLLARRLRQFARHLNPALRILVVDVVPGFIARQLRGRLAISNRCTPYHSTKCAMHRKTISRAASAPTW